MKKLLFLIFALSIHFAAHAVDGFSTLEERMSGQDFQKAGLGKLTSEELAALNEWLRDHSVATLKNVASNPGAGTTNNVAGGDMRGFANQPKDETRGDTISGEIEGTFDGWAGKGTIFKLTNGMIWQQTEKDSYYVAPVTNPKITIEKTMLGKWHLSLVGQKKKVRVERIQ